MWSECFQISKMLTPKNGRLEIFSGENQGYVALSTWFVWSIWSVLFDGLIQSTSVRRYRQRASKFDQQISYEWMKRTSWVDTRWNPTMNLRSFNASVIIGFSTKFQILSSQFYIYLSWVKVLVQVNNVWFILRCLL